MAGNFPTKCKATREQLGITIDCPLRNSCWRFTAPAGADQQWLPRAPWHDSPRSHPWCPMQWKPRGIPQEKKTEEIAK